MIENALVAANGRTVAEGRAEVAGLWARFNEVARTNPLAAFPKALDAAAIDTPSPDNRPLAFPYNKWHASQWTVDQAAALVLCSVETAVRLRVPPERWVFPVVGLDSSHAVSLLARRQPETWPAMKVLGRAAAARISRPVGECEVIEVYSCFPSAVRVQQRALDLDPDQVPTVTGGMAFAGGPFNNFVLQATVAVAERLRGDPSALGVVTTVSGLLTKPGIGVWSAGPDGRPPLVGDLAGEAAATTEVVEVADDDAATQGKAGAATVVTATVAYDGLEPARTLALCDRPDGRRTVAMSEDRSLAAHVVAHGLAGESVEVRAGELLFG
jgi:acetyl-CoA C-acetyltransferase